MIHGSSRGRWKPSSGIVITWKSVLLFLSGFIAAISPWIWGDLVLPDGYPTNNMHIPWVWWALVIVGPEDCALTPISARRRMWKEANEQSDSLLTMRRQSIQQRAEHWSRKTQF